jgi:thioesterase domain-containing protein
MEGSAIAVIGMAGRFPGGGDLTAFWNSLSAGDDAYGRLDGVDMFDASFFGIGPQDAVLRDPHHRLFLECAWEAFEHAGYVGELVAGPVGVFASCGTRNAGHLLATRVSCELNLHGPSVTLQTPCSSTLAAIHLACRSLLDGECDLALAGGATVRVDRNEGHLACVILKRLSRAERDGDNVLAVLRGSAIDGVPEAPPRPDAAPSHSHHLLVLSARTEAALDAATMNLARHLSEHPAASLADVAFTLAVGRKTFRHRRAVVASSVEDAVQRLVSTDAAGASTCGDAFPPRGVVLLFPDSDAIYSGMGRELYRSERVFRENVDACRAVLRSRLPHVKGDPRDVIMDQLQAGAEAASPSLALLGLLVVEYAMSRLFSSWGVVPVALLGRGTGEIAAACVAGVMSVEDAIAIVAEQGAWLDTSAEPQRATATSSQDLAALCRTIHLRKPSIPLVAGTSGTWITDAQATDPQYWVDQICRGPRLEAALRAVLEKEDRVLIEVGPGETMSRLARRLPRCGNAFATLSPSDIDASEVATLLEAMGAMWAAGDIELGGLYEGRARRRVPLPTYPWQRRRYSLAPFSSVASPAPPATPGLEAADVEPGDPVAAPREAFPASAEFRSLVTIQQGDGRRPIFCVHGAGGDVIDLPDLARSLPAGQPFFGLQARGVDGVLAPHETIEEMAEAYLAEIRGCQPHGPYVLAGYAGGGLVALEIARRITESGDAVDLLLLIDTVPPGAPVRAMTMPRRFERLKGEGLRYVRSAVESTIAARRLQIDLAEARRRALAGEPIPVDLREPYLIECFEKAVAHYRPRVWAGRAMLFRAEKVKYVLADVDPGYGWEHIISDLEISIVPCNHDDLLRVPHSPALVSALGRAIEEAGLQLRGQRRSHASRVTRTTTPLGPMLRLGEENPGIAALGGQGDPFGENGHGTLPGAGDDIPPASV